MTPKIRQSVYLAGTVISGIVGILLLWGGIDAGAAANLDQIVTGLGALIGGGANAAAARKVNTQRKDGTFETAEEVSPVDQVINSLPVIVQKANDAAADLERVKEAAAAVAGATPVIGPLAKEAIEQILNPRR
ncbi:holin [Mycobacterium phage Adzzy]|uniref:holin n=1 Tax=Mycobacterium phage Adzzy TaxID=1383059 RepID=UPI0003881197|nr:holin [Mycobacterium phage Adzzy]AGT14261.1 hypothetical protein ADZZY_12 [Mycobacterium phage Adzzy]ATW60140.1 holin [Mycobacterium phage Ph8s]